MKNGKSQVPDAMWRTVTLTRTDQEKHSDWGGMAGLRQK